MYYKYSNARRVQIGWRVAYIQLIFKEKANVKKNNKSYCRRMGEILQNCKQNELWRPHTLIQNMNSIVSENTKFVQIRFCEKNKENKWKLLLGAYGTGLPVQ